MLCEKWISMPYRLYMPRFDRIQEFDHTSTKTRGIVSLSHINNIAMYVT